ncbi:hypothetical protein C8R43DRAFT_703788 [Mycena crocata]|nr:hypothetical protein C8R43DRAFT_703788 [Mycena crocata]
MRLKIQSVPPLPLHKVWFTPGEDCLTVAHLKSALVRQVFKSTLKSASPLDLSLDGFDLLEASTLVDILRDGDLVVVKEGERKTEVGKKRKRSTSPVKQKTRYPPLPSLASSSSSSASASSSSSSSSSSSDSDSDSDSDSSSSSGSSSTPPTSASTKQTLVPQTQKARRSAPTTTTSTPVSTGPMVPPGKGKPSTHSRNVRRRTKRAAATAPPSLPDFVSAANATPAAKPDADVDRRAKARQGKIHGPAPDVASALNNAFGGNEKAGRLDPGTLSPASASSSTLHTPQYPPSEAEETLHVQMMSMLPKSKNKNKSRRSGGDVDPRSRKIVFGTPPPPEEQEEDEEEAPRISRPVLIPPSELPSHLIPSNVFITSIDVEEGLKQKSKKKKRRVEEAEPWAADEAVLEEIVLNYGEEESEEGPPEPDPSTFNFDKAPLIASLSQLTTGCIVGFEALILNNFTPEYGRRYGRVVSWTEERVIVHPMYEGAEDEVGDEDFSWDQVQGQWRLLR